MSPAERIQALLTAHPEITVHLTIVDDLDDDDAAMVEQVIQHLETKRARAQPPR